MLTVVVHKKIKVMQYVKNKDILNILKTAEEYVFGQQEMLLAIVSAVVCEGHLLIEGMPGLGKTLSVSTISKLMDLDFKRIQFTPDLLPSDLIGTQIYSQKKEEFETKFGPIFTQLLLADEINRSPAKVQSALLESMAERQVTIGESTYELKKPFVVLATQNPVDQEGTYQLPEAQLDRFMVKCETEYPDEDSERSIVEATNSGGQINESIWNLEKIAELREAIEAVHVDKQLVDFIVKIVRSTRPNSTNFDKSNFGKYIQFGASPRATIWLYKLSKFHAFCCDRDHVIPDDILYNVYPVLGHRVVLSYDAKIDEINVKNLLNDLANRNL